MYYIYKIENLVNHKKYIGLTNNINRRRARHFTDLSCGRHDNNFLQKEYDKYGKENFSFEKIFEGDVSVEEISLKEQYYIEQYDSYYEGYNQNKGGNFGPTNGGSHLVRSDILNILATTEFMKRPGTVLGKIFNVSNTTIMRIKNGTNHCETYEEYHKMPIEKRKELFNIFCEANNLQQTLEESHKIEGKRKLNKEQVFMILANAEFKIMPNTHIAKLVGIKSPYTTTCVARRENYKEYAIEYDKLSNEEKQKIVTLLSNK